MRLIDADALKGEKFYSYERHENCVSVYAIDMMPTITIPTAELDTTEDSGEWIPCSERLPEKQGQYYVSGGNKVWICDFLIFSNLKGGWCNNVSNPVVEAWMPLPEPYKKEGEAE